MISAHTLYPSKHDIFCVRGLLRSVRCPFVANITVGRVITIVIEVLWDNIVVPLLPKGVAQGCAAYLANRWWHNVALRWHGGGTPLCFPCVGGSPLFPLVHFGFYLGFELFSRPFTPFLLLFPCQEVEVFFKTCKSCLLLQKSKLLTKVQDKSGTDHLGDNMVVPLAERGLHWAASHSLSAGGGTVPPPTDEGMAELGVLPFQLGRVFLGSFSLHFDVPLGFQLCFSPVYSYYFIIL